MKRVKSKILKRYSITQIFPVDISAEKYLMFRKLWNPNGRYNGSENLIALCIDCSAAYLAETELSEFSKLLKIKKELLQHFALQQAMERIDLETELSEIVNGLAKMDSDQSINELSMEAVRVREKIGNAKILLDSVSDDVLHYYSYIQDLFSQVDSNESGKFDLIANEVHQAFLRIEESGMSKEETVSFLTEWIIRQLKMTDDMRIAANIIISFFIQNCEVFHASAK